RKMPAARPQIHPARTRHRGGKEPLRLQKVRHCQRAESQGGFLQERPARRKSIHGRAINRFLHGTPHSTSCDIQSEAKPELDSIEKPHSLECVPKALFVCNQAGFIKPYS